MVLVKTYASTLEKISTAEEKAKVWFIHLNHTNPLLIEGSDAYRNVREQGYNVAREGVRLPL